MNLFCIALNLHYLCGMKKKFSKWFMDIGKYVATAVIISRFLGGLENELVMYIGGVAIVAICVALSIVLDKDKNKK